MYKSFLVILGAWTIICLIIYYGLNKVLLPQGSNRHAIDDPVSAVSDAHAHVHSDRYIIYTCDGTFYCGGWADRLKGVVAAYLLANATNRKFGIHMTVPCDISNYLLPNLIDWRIDVSKLGNDSTSFFMGMSDAVFMKNTELMKLENTFPHRVTYFAFNLDIVPHLRRNVLYSDNFKWMVGMKNHEVFSHVYKTLFRLSPALEEKLQEFNMKLPLGSSLKCAQIRLGRNPSNLNDTEVRGSYYDVRLVWDFFRGFHSGQGSLEHSHSDHHHHHGNHHHHHGNHHHHHHHSNNENFKIFVTSDSEQVRADAAKYFPDLTVDLPGPLVHIERSTKVKEEMCGGFSKVILDQIVLASCETLIIGQSGFGEISSYLRGSDSNLYCFRHSALYRCSMSNFDVSADRFTKLLTVMAFGALLLTALVCWIFAAKARQIRKCIRMKLLRC
ncbi:uncharacterized protein LOC124278827 [Haliotis rubra]|uniref:uncharacterized protein LOC124278827 n=1 Tax=Haliotis rubra TaxID=36100 RepID=UPI001EE4FF88|nr:uncharacterized protein LOC124278827 [Haliotis rubra]